MKTTIAIALISAMTLLASPALAQTQEDDHATTSSGHDAQAEAQGKMRIAEGETPTGAEDMDHTFGIGYGQTPGGVTGFAAEYYLGNLMLNGHAAFLFFAPDGGDSATAFALAAGAFYSWKTYDNLRVMLGARLDLGHTGGGSDSGGAKAPQVYGSFASATQVNLELVMRAQLYVFGMMAVYAEVGPVIAFIGDNGGVLGESWQSERKGVYIDLPSTNQIASFGVTIYTK